ncbi:MAG: peptide ABC transporter substrate-binding protein, partial [Planctomycetota bacterium]|nr:peptide ABC transporter substrate-binding protein [Planctomycetota bacterium]
GPFLLESWLPNDRIRLRKNPKYWNADSIKLETIDALSIEDTMAALNAFLKGDADWNPSNWPSSLNPELRKLPTFKTSAAFITYYYRFNTTRKHFADARVRRAFCMAINRTEIVENITALGETSAHTLVPPGIPGYVPPPGAQYDPEQARKLLAEAGYPGGKGFPEIELLYNTNESHKSVALVLARQLQKNLGVSVRPYNQEWQSYQADTRAKKYDLARAGWIGDYLDPNTFLDMWLTGGGNNQTGYGSELYDRLHRIGKDIPAFLGEADDAFYAQLVEGDEMRKRVEAAKAVPKSDVETLLARCADVRMLVFKEMERLICELDCPIMCIYFYVTKNLVKDRIGGFYTHVGPAGGKVDNVRDVHPLRGFFVKEEE